MSKINSNMADYLTQIETLTNTNLQILKTLNDSFYTNKNHIYTEINDTTYVIPSFISLENKINMLQENFENLVKAPENCEAYFNFDGNSRSIEVRKYNHTPDSLTLPEVKNFSIENNDIFKDFMTPVPYINLELPNIPNDIVEVNVKKIIPHNESLKNIFKSKLAENASSTSAAFADIYKVLINYKEDVDYVNYDTIHKLPVHKSIGTATYVIESVISDEIDNNLNEIITLKLRNNLTDNKLSNTLTYKIFDETIEKPLQAGDKLINFDGTGKVEIIEVRTSTNTIVVRVVNGEYLNFIGTDSYETNSDNDINDLSKLRFYDTIDFNSDKVVKIPLEEDQYVFVAVAPLNSRMNIQSSWGTGLLIDTYSLNNIEGNKSFKTYYDENVKNLGDVLFEMTAMITSPISKLSNDNFTYLTKLKPDFIGDEISVMQINKHLNNSTTVKNIRDAYTQKKITEAELKEVQKKIADINDQLSTISFEDTTGTRTIYTAQLTELNKKKNELITSINNSMDVISLNVNSAEVPIENAKYRIRGFYTPRLESFGDININDHVIGLKVQYRYKNISSETGAAVSINSVDGETYIYSDWNDLKTFNRSKIAKCNNGIYTYQYEEHNETVNEPSFNQIDIPISQGETVDIRVKLIFDFGQPYITMTSDWSDIINIKFPEEFTKDVPVLKIIEENNNDIESNRFNNILNTSGTTDHVNDSVVDQNITYYHKPENIASGFYTEERRIIPLKDKLQSILNDISQIKSDIYDSTGNYKVTAVVGNIDNIIYSDRENNVILEPYNSFLNNSDETINGAYNYSDGLVSTSINIIITNTGETALKLYSLFPGNRDIPLNDTKASYVSKDNYCSKDGAVLIAYPEDKDTSYSQQGQNQFVTFRINDAWTGIPYYTTSADVSTNNEQKLVKIKEDIINEINSLSSKKLGMIAYPYVDSVKGLCIESDSTRSYTVINPGENIIIPIMCTYKATENNTYIKKTISFDLRTSLYNDPINYSFGIIAKNSASLQDKLNNSNKNRIWNRITDNISKYNTVIK